MISRALKRQASRVKYNTIFSLVQWIHKLKQNDTETNYTTKNIMSSALWTATGRRNATSFLGVEGASRARGLAKWLYWAGSHGWHLSEVTTAPRNRWALHKQRGRRRLLRLTTQWFSSLNQGLLVMQIQNDTGLSLNPFILRRTINIICGFAFFFFLF